MTDHCEHHFSILGTFERPRRKRDDLQPIVDSLQGETGRAPSARSGHARPLRLRIIVMPRLDGSREIRVQGWARERWVTRARFRSKRHMLRQLPALFEEGFVMTSFARGERLP